MLDWIPRKIRYALVGAAILGLFAPLGLSSTSVVVGHTVFVDATGSDPCLASIVGLARSTVLWFNDMPLVSTDPQGQWVYVTRAGAESPFNPDGGLPQKAEGAGSTVPIYGDGVIYEFVDPNGFRWEVLEGYYPTTLKSGVNPDVTGISGGNVSSVTNPPENVVANGAYNREFVWMVQIQGTHHDAYPGPDAHSFYNFVSVVDTCKLQEKPDGQMNFSADDPYHPPGTPAHSHDMYDVDLYIGKEPTFIPVGPDANADASNSTIYAENQTFSPGDIPP
jgi:hypothetical protein